MASFTLGGQEFNLQPYKLRELRPLLDALEAMEGKHGGAMIDAAANVLVVGLSPLHPEITAEQILDLEASVDDLNAAVGHVVDMAGFKRQGEQPPVAMPGAA